MNENEIERRLRAVPLTRPSDNLDRRMQALFEDAAAVGPHPLRWSVPVWLMAAACMVCAAAGFEAHTLIVRRERPPAVVCVVQPDETLSRFLMGKGAHRSDGLELSNARIRVITQPVSAGNQL